MWHLARTLRASGEERLYVWIDTPVRLRPGTLVHAEFLSPENKLIILHESRANPEALFDSYWSVENRREYRARVERI